MKITEMNNCIEKMRECYKFDDNKTEIKCPKCSCISKIGKDVNKICIKS